ncbi:MAG: hypothetical protein ABIR28_13970 [Vicinamibacteria bacterium]
MIALGVICLLVPILIIRATMQRIRGLGAATDHIAASVRGIAEAFRTGKVETTLRGYATEVRGVSRFQFAELKQLESFERTDSQSLAWGAIPLPDVVVEARGQVVYTYVLDLQKRWDLRLSEHTVDVIAPAPEFSTPALDPSSLTFEIKKGSVLRDEVAVKEGLRAGLSNLLNERARQHLPLVRETGRKRTEEFVRNFLLANYDDAAGMTVRVRFSDEPSAARTVPLAIEGKPKPIQ